VERRQVTDIAPPPPRYVTEYRIITRTCPGCAAPRSGTAPQEVPARAQYEPRVLATAAELTCAHYLPVGRAAALLATLAGVEVSVGFVASVRGRAARLLEQTFLPRVRARWGCCTPTRPPPTPPMRRNSPLRSVGSFAASVGGRGR
jgi:transposase